MAALGVWKLLFCHSTILSLLQGQNSQMHAQKGPYVKNNYTIATVHMFISHLQSLNEFTLLQGETWLSAVSTKLIPDFIVQTKMQTMSLLEDDGIFSANLARCFQQCIFTTLNPNFIHKCVDLLGAQITMRECHPCVSVFHPLSPSSPSCTMVSSCCFCSLQSLGLQGNL